MFRYLIPLLIVVMVAIWGCSEDDYPVELEQTQIERLLTGDTTKTWIPAAPLTEECQLVQSRIFSISGTATARVRTYETEIFSPDCPEDTPPGDTQDEEEEDVEEDTDNDEDAQTGTWAVTKLGDIYNLSIYHADTTHFEIKEITAQKLDLVQKDSSEVLNLKVLLVN